MERFVADRPPAGKARATGTIWRAEVEIEILAQWGGEPSRTMPRWAPGDGTVPSVPPDGRVLDPMGGTMWSFSARAAKKAMR
jgi:hypothetical protein